MALPIRVGPISGVNINAIHPSLAVSELFSAYRSASLVVVIYLRYTDHTKIIAAITC
jgi:hypothetical protein